MASADGAGIDGIEPATTGTEFGSVLRRSLITGTAIIIPAAVTLLVLGFVINFLSNTLDPIAKALQQSPILAESTSSILIKVTSVAVFLLTVFWLGFLAEFTDRGDRLGDQFDDFMASVPGIGSVYRSFDEMSEMLLDSDTESFQDVKLIEYPGEGSYVVAFKTSDTPRALEAETGHEEMVTLFMPMAPNPVMGGFVIHVDASRVVDVDMTVEQGIQSIVTSGVAFGDDGPGLGGLTAGELRELGQVERVEQQINPGVAAPGATRNDDHADRVEMYDEGVAPEYADTPEEIARRGRRGRPRHGAGRHDARRARRP
jgi:uncharacterized membrane protein